MLIKLIRSVGPLVNITVIIARAALFVLAVLFMLRLMYGIG